MLSSLDGFGGQFEHEDDNGNNDSSGNAHKQKYATLKKNES